MGERLGDVSQGTKAKALLLAQAKAGEEAPNPPGYEFLVSPDLALSFYVL